MPDERPVKDDGLNASRPAEDWLHLNRSNWDERVPIHVRSELYDVPEFVLGKEPLYRFELRELGDLAGKDVVHLQCHFGMDTLSLARKGARVTGLDFSPPALEAARKLATEVGLEARFVQANVYDAVSALGETYDLVYTGKGALNWLPDIGEWAAVVASLLRPGGALYLSEFHPLLFAFADDDLLVEHPYFNEGPIVWDDGSDYADPAARIESARTVEWPHPFSEVVSSVIEAGLRLEFLHEFRECGFARFPFLVESRPGLFVTPPGMPSLPMMYSLRAVKQP